MEMIHMTEIQLLHVTELLSQLGDQVVKTERTETDFRIHLSGDRWIRITPAGDKEWFLNGLVHRTDGPAVEWTNGDKFWYLNGQQHRTDGPAIERANGDKLWFLNNKSHRTDGPAVERANGDKHWYLHGAKQQKSV
jgi:hypothetical protein